MYHPLENVINEDTIKIKKIRQELLDIINNHNVTASNYGHELYRCERCDKLYREFYVELHYDEGKIYKTEYKCTKCRVQLKRLEEINLEEIPCPECHEKELWRDMEMMWD